MSERAVAHATHGPRALDGVPDLGDGGGTLQESHGVARPDPGGRLGGDGPAGIAEGRRDDGGGAIEIPQVLMGGGAPEAGLRLPLAVARAPGFPNGPAEHVDGLAALHALIAVHAPVEETVDLQQAHVGLALALAGQRPLPAR